MGEKRKLDLHHVVVFLRGASPDVLGQALIVVEALDKRHTMQEAL
jgi:hypothetical protein